MKMEKAVAKVMKVRKLSYRGIHPPDPLLVEGQRTSKTPATSKMID